MGRYIKPVAIKILRPHTIRVSGLEELHITTI
jgi:hypothetical protein